MTGGRSGEVFLTRCKRTSDVVRLAFAILQEMVRPSSREGCVSGTEPWIEVKNGRQIEIYMKYSRFNFGGDRRSISCSSEVVYHIIIYPHCLMNGVLTPVGA